MHFCRAPLGKTACTLGTTVEASTPPSGPMTAISCLKREISAKNRGISAVRIRWILRSRTEFSDSIWPETESLSKKCAIGWSLASFYLYKDLPKAVPKASRTDWSVASREWAFHESP